MEHAVAEAKAALANSGTSAEGLSLTRRERQVAELITRGLTNRAIATKLVVSERTIDAHVEHIGAKLGLRSHAHLAPGRARTGLGTNGQIWAFSQ
ncbi:MAG TPA: helix-turn-helix transcriptional regulator [Chloroflexota bacterium]